MWQAFYIVLTGSQPFTGEARTEKEVRKYDGPNAGPGARQRLLFKRIRRGRFKLRSHFSDEAAALLTALLTVDPAARLADVGVCAHAFFGAE